MWWEHGIPLNHGEPPYEVCLGFRPSVLIGLGKDNALYPFGHEPEPLPEVRFGGLRACYHRIGDSPAYRPGIGGKLLPWYPPPLYIVVYPLAQALLEGVGWGWIPGVVVRIG